MINIGLIHGSQTTHQSSFTSNIKIRFLNFSIRKHQRCNMHGIMVTIIR